MLMASYAGWVESCSAFSQKLYISCFCLRFSEGMPNVTSVASLDVAGLALIIVLRVEF